LAQARQGNPGSQLHYLSLTKNVAMVSITLHFNVFGQVSPGDPEGKTSLRVDDLGCTIGALKARLFPVSSEDQKTIRFISRGKIMKDTDVVGQCGLGSEAHIHVSVSERSDKSSPARKPSSVSEVSDDGSGAGASTGATAASGEPKQASNSSDAPREDEEGSGLSSFQLLAAVAIAGAGVLLRLAWQKRWHLSMHASQMVFICGACWVYVVLFHGLPTFLQLARHGARSMGRVGAKPAAGDRAAAQPPAGPLLHEPLLSPASADLASSASSALGAAAASGPAGLGGAAVLASSAPAPL